MFLTTLINQAKLEDFVQGALKYFLIYFRGSSSEYCRRNVNYSRHPFCTHVRCWCDSSCVRKAWWNQGFFYSHKGLCNELQLS